MGGRIDCYLEIASLYSYVALGHLLANVEKLAAQDAQVELHSTVFLSGIIQATSNQPPWLNPIKGAYLRDARRALRTAGITTFTLPKDLRARANSSPAALRALLAVQARGHPPAVFHAALRSLFGAFWGGVDLAEEAALGRALGEVFAAEVGALMAARKAMRPVLRGETARALERGAFDTPWLWVRDKAGREEPFFGSDRFGEVYRFLGVRFHDVEVLATPEKAKL